MQRVFLRDRSYVIHHTHVVVVVNASDAVVLGLDRVLVVCDLCKAFCLCVVGEARSVVHIEVAVVVEQYSFGCERLSTVGHSGVAGKLLGLHVLKPFAVPQRHEQVLLLGCGLQHARIGKYDGLVLVRSRHTIDHNAIQFARVQIFLLYVNV